LNTCSIKASVNKKGTTEDSVIIIVITWIAKDINWIQHARLIQGIGEY
jgi:hypothetical protein